jgi:hypothetical protein
MTIPELYSHTCYRTTILRSVVSWRGTVAFPSTNRTLRKVPSLYVGEGLTEKAANLTMHRLILATMSSSDFEHQWINGTPRKVKANKEHELFVESEPYISHHLSHSVITVFCCRSNVPLVECQLAIRGQMWLYEWYIDLWNSPDLHDVAIIRLETLTQISHREQPKYKWWSWMDEYLDAWVRV